MAEERKNRPSDEGKRGEKPLDLIGKKKINSGAFQRLGHLKMKRDQRRRDGREKLPRIWNAILCFDPLYNLMLQISR